MSYESYYFGDSVSRISESNKVGKISHSCLDCSLDNTVQGLAYKEVKDESFAG